MGYSPTGTVRENVYESSEGNQDYGTRSTVYFSEEPGESETLKCDPVVTTGYTPTVGVE